MANDDAELDFKTKVTDLLWKSQLTEALLTQLLQQTGIPGMQWDNENDFAHKIVFAAFREPGPRDRLLERIPVIFPSTKERLGEIIANYKKADGKAQADSGHEATTDPDEPFGAATGIASRVTGLVELRSKYRAALLEETQFDPSNMIDLRGELMIALRNIGDSRDNLVRRSKQLSASMRRLLSALTRIEEGIESCLDAIIYYNQVGNSIENSRRTTAGVGTTDADRATAELVRLRELNYSREQIRYRLTRLSEQCERANSEF